MPCKANLVALFALLFSLASGTVLCGELVSTMEMDFSAHGTIDGVRLVPAKDVPASVYTEDHAPPQVLEIIRPGQAPISVGRLMTSCTCLRATMEKRDFGQGERALIEVRNVKPTPPEGATYLVFVRLNQPFQATLQYELFVRSTPKQAAPPPAASGRPVPAPQHGAGPGQNFKYDNVVPYPPRGTGTPPERP